MDIIKLRNDDLEVLQCVAHSQSFSAAARELQISPKMVSKQIARLEAALGTTLFERNTRNIRMTDEGRAIADRAGVALSVLNEIKELATSGRQELTGNIRLTVPAPFGRKYVTSAITDFCKLHPLVSFDLQLSDHIEDLYCGGFDMAIRIGELQDSTLLSRRITINRRIIVASHKFISIHGEPLHPEDLIHFNCLIFSYPGMQQNNWLLKRGKQTTNAQVSGTLCSDNGDALHEWCISGLGISLRETWDVQDALRNGQLKRILPEWEGITSKISLVRAHRDPVPRRLTEFCDFLFERWHQAPWDH